MTPADQVPAPPPQPPPAVSGLLQLIGPLLVGFLGPQGSGRRLLVSLPGVLLLCLNHKIGLDLDFNSQSLIAGTIVAIVAASNTKEALITRAQVAGQSAAIVAQHQANAAVQVAQAGADAAAAS